MFARIMRVHTDRRRGGLRLFWGALFAAAATLSSVAQALPVIPNAAGFGMDTPAGRGGKVYRVTSLSASGTGTLKQCVDASGPRVCVFETSGIIRLHSDLVVHNPYLTIAGQTAPSPGITLLGAALWIQTHDVLVQHIRVRVGDDPDGPSFENRDALKLASDTGTNNVVIDHCSLSWAVDENIDAYSGWDNLTISNTIISEPLHDSHNPLGPSGYGVVIGPWNGKATMTGNLFAHNVERNPLSRGAQLVFTNNVIYNRENMDVDLQSTGGMVTKNTVVGNVFVRGPDYSRHNKPVLVRTSGSLAIQPGTQLYVADNVALESSISDPWAVVGTSDGTAVPSAIKSGVLPAWPVGLTRLPTDSNTVYDNVLKYAGARPADRDSIDKRVVDSVRNRKGQIINCVAPDGTARCERNAGGWPTLAVNTRKLTLPSNPNTVTPSGYTNLEVWLQKMAADVEGRSETSPPAPVLSIK